jgi:hypothetical protein
MAHAPHHAPPPAAEKFDPKDFGILPTVALGAAAIGIFGSLIGLAFSREQFAHSWLFAFAYFFTITVGAFFWICLHHATDAQWSVVIRRIWENTVSLLPWLALIFLPLFLCAPMLWHWWDLDPSTDVVLKAKSGYLSQSFFIIRYLAYFCLLSFWAWTFRSRSIAQDSDGAARHTIVLRKFGVSGIIVLGLCLTFAAFDWLMGLDWHWFSTMWGVYIFAGAAGASISLTVIVVTLLKNRGYLKPVTLEHYHIMGKFMLTFTIFWAYIGFSQYMLIWYANIPEENSYFRLRNTDSWWYFSTFLVIGRFFLPFPILLTQWIKKQPRYLCMVAGWILFMQLLDMYVVVLPSLHHSGFDPSILDLCALLGIGGTVAWLWMRKLPTACLFPTRDPRLAESLNLTN